MPNVRKRPPEIDKMTPSQLKREVQVLRDKLDEVSGYGYCYMCDTHKSKDKFYVSTDPKIKSGITPICKECARKIALRVDKDGEHEPTKESVQEALKYLNKPFLNSLWDSSVQESENLLSGKTKSNPWTAYIKNVAMGNYNGMTYEDSDTFKMASQIAEEKEAQNQKDEESLILAHSGQDAYDSYLKNKRDVIRLLDYDPFESEAVSDQPLLYSQLLGMLDASEDQNDDMMRIASCVSIVRGFLQESKIDDTITKLMSDVHSVESNSATIKSLQESKAKISSIITNLAAESCISLKNNKNAKKGENTWTGKTKKIKDMDLREGRVNGFDIETSKAMRQVMDLSNQSILQELKLDETDWSDMVAEQREMIVDLQNQLDRYIEVSRILLSENLDLKDFLESQDIHMEGYEYVDLEDLFSPFSAENEEGGDEN